MKNVTTQYSGAPLHNLLQSREHPAYRNPFIYTYNFSFTKVVSFGNSVKLSETTDGFSFFIRIFGMFLQQLSMYVIRCRANIPRISSSKGGQTGTLAESVPVCPPWPKMSQIALQGGQTGTAVPDCPPWRAIWGQPPALGKKEGGSKFGLREGNLGRF